MKSKKMLSETGYDRFLEETLKMYIEHVFTYMKEDTELFETLLCSYRSRRRAVQNANGRYTEYSLSRREESYKHKFSAHLLVCPQVKKNIQS